MDTARVQHAAHELQTWDEPLLREIARRIATELQLPLAIVRPAHVAALARSLQALQLKTIIVPSSSSSSSSSSSIQPPAASSSPTLNEQALLCPEPVFRIPSRLFRDPSVLLRMASLVALRNKQLSPSLASFAQSSASSNTSISGEALDAAAAALFAINDKQDDRRLPETLLKDLFTVGLWRRPTILFASSVPAAARSCFLPQIANLLAVVTDSFTTDVTHVVQGDDIPAGQNDTLEFYRTVDKQPGWYTPDSKDVWVHESTGHYLDPENEEDYEVDDPELLLIPDAPSPVPAAPPATNSHSSPAANNNPATVHTVSSTAATNQPAPTPAALADDYDDDEDDIDDIDERETAQHSQPFQSTQTTQRRGPKPKSYVTPVSLERRIQVKHKRYEYEPFATGTLWNISPASLITPKYATQIDSLLTTSDESADINSESPSQSDSLPSWLSLDNIHQLEIQEFGWHLMSIDGNENERYAYMEIRNAIISKAQQIAPEYVSIAMSAKLVPYSDLIMVVGIHSFLERHGVINSKV
eukprot:jgi/Hompol1/5916/HPOL_002094-RA